MIYGDFGNKRLMVKETLTQDAWGNWECRIQFFDDDTEDRQSGFGSRAAAHGWAQVRIDRHFRLGVPGRLAGPVV